MGGFEDPCGHLCIFFGLVQITDTISFQSASSLRTGNLACPGESAKLEALAIRTDNCGLPIVVLRPVPRSGLERVSVHQSGCICVLWELHSKKFFSRVRMGKVLEYWFRNTPLNSKRPLKIHPPSDSTLSRTVLLPSPRRFGSPVPPSLR